MEGLLDGVRNSHLDDRESRRTTENVSPSPIPQTVLPSPQPFLSEKRVRAVPQLRLFEKNGEFGGLMWRNSISDTMWKIKNSVETEIRKQERETARCLEKLSTLSERIERISKVVGLMSDSLSNRRREKNDLRMSLHRLAQELAEIDIQKMEIQRQIENFTNEFRGWMSAISSDVHLMTSKSDDKVRKKIGDLQESLSECRRKLRGKELLAEENSIRLKEYEKEMRRLGNERKDLRGKFLEAVSTLQASGIEIRRVRQERDESRMKLEESTAKEAELSRRLATRSDENEQLRANDLNESVNINHKKSFFGVDNVIAETEDTLERSFGRISELSKSLAAHSVVVGENTELKEELSQIRPVVDALKRVLLPNEGSLTAEKVFSWAKTVRTALETEEYASHAKEMIERKWEELHHSISRLKRDELLEEEVVRLEKRRDKLLSEVRKLQMMKNDFNDAISGVEFRLNSMEKLKEKLGNLSNFGSEDVVPIPVVHQILQESHQMLQDRMNEFEEMKEKHEKMVEKKNKQIQELQQNRNN